MIMREYLKAKCMLERSRWTKMLKVRRTKMKKQTVKQSASDVKVQSSLINLPKIMHVKIPIRGKNILKG